MVAIFINTVRYNQYQAQAQVHFVILIPWVVAIVINTVRYNQYYKQVQPVFHILWVVATAINTVVIKPVSVTWTLCEPHPLGACLSHQHS